MFAVFAITPDPGSALAVDEAPDEAVNLVLGGGGAKGFVHVGVLQFLADHRIAVDSIVGTSSGAIIGSLYAHLLDIRRLTPSEAVGELKRWCLDEDFSAFLDSPSVWRRSKDAVLRKPGTLYLGEALRQWLRGKLGDARVSELKRPVIITATDRYTGQEFLFTSKDTMDRLTETAREFRLAGQSDGTWSQQGATTALYDAVQASASIQGYFPPMYLDGRWFWDGGNAGAVRSDLGWRINPRIPTIGVSLTYKVSPMQAERLPDILLHTINILTARVEALQEQGTMTALQQQSTTVARQRSGLALPRILTVTPSITAGDRQVGTLDFSLTRNEKLQLIGNGYAAMTQYFNPTTRQFRTR